MHYACRHHRDWEALRAATHRQGDRWDRKDDEERYVMNFFDKMVDPRMGRF